MRRQWFPFAVVIALILAALAVVIVRRRQAAPKPQARAAAASLPAAAGLTFTGSIRAQHFISVAATIPGNIEAFMANPGDEVFTGQALARIGGLGLESARETAARQVERVQERVTKAEAAVDVARLEQSRAMADAQRVGVELRRAQDAYGKQSNRFSVGAISRNEFQASESAYKAASADAELKDKAVRAADDYVNSSVKLVELAKKELAEKMQDLEAAQGGLDAGEVRAPVDGWVVARSGEIGKPASETGEEMFRIATDLYALEVTVEPPPPVLKRIYPKMPALVLIPELTNSAFTGQVKGIDRTMVIVEFGNPLPAVRPGMKADVRFKLD
jgi:HlyD family secretion protein